MPLKYIKTAKQQLETLAYLYAYWLMLVVIIVVVEISGNTFDIEKMLWGTILLWAIPSVPTLILYANYLKQSKISQILMDEKGVEIRTSNSRPTLINWQDISSLEKISSTQTGLAPRAPWINGKFYFYRIISKDSLPVIITCLLEQVEETSNTLESVFGEKGIPYVYKEKFYPFIP